MSRLSFIFILLPLATFAQKFEKRINETDTFYTLPLTILEENKGMLPDGKWKVYFDTLPDQVRYIFNVKEGNVDGFFYCFYDNGQWQRIGNYKVDSLWTFLDHENPEIRNRFKVGVWAGHVAGLTKVDTFNLPFKEKDTLYYDRWFDEDGNLTTERIFHKTRGLISREEYSSNGQPIYSSKEMKGFTQETSWTSDGKLISIQIDNEDYVSVHLDTEPDRFSNCSNCTEITYSHGKGNWNNAFTSRVDTTGNVVFFHSSNVTIDYDEKGIPKEITYINEDGKRKTVKLK